LRVDKKKYLLNAELTKVAEPIFLDYLKVFRDLAPSLGEELFDLPLPLGGVGYLGYEFFNQIECVDFKRPKLYDCYENAFIFGRDFVVFDHFYETVFVVNVSYAQEISPHNPKENVQMILESLKELPKKNFTRCQAESEIISKDKEAYYTQMVETLKGEIYKGNLLQCVPSQSMQIKSSLPPLQAYMNLRTNNPSPYMYFYDFGYFQIIGNSPEALISVSTPRDSSCAKLVLRPIAGTRPRGENQLEDFRLEEELKNDPKENAEHLMLLDLGRNDIGKVAIGGSVRVTQNKVIEKYARVMHLVSEVQGDMDLRIHQKTDALLAAFPAGTVSGAPKIQAIKTIESLEQHSRGIYAGAIGYFMQNCDMSFAIAIRTAIYQKGVYYLQAGGGIVYDSNPKLEYIETKNKMLSLIEAIIGTYGNSHDSS
ncbi:MAG: anthranilate synthase component I family protein, partial [Helicobacter sp.]|nr:anthranilate synthase component I family protein [Helicobacter sp.]